MAHGKRERTQELPPKAMSRRQSEETEMIKKLMKLSLKTREMTAVYSHLEPLCSTQQVRASSSATAKGR